MDTYYLSRNVHFCSVGEQVVFLDVINDRYSCLGAAHGAAFRAAIAQDEHTTTDGPLRLVAAGQAQNLFAAMERKGLVTRTGCIDSGSATQKTDLSMRPAARDLIRAHDVREHDRLATQAKAETRRMGQMAFLAACVRADATLRLRSFSKTVESVARRPRREADSDAVCAAALVFRRMRPYYPRAYLCMFDSLALIHFLARRGLGVDFVFGVDLTPFEAHCWVQSGDVVLNDDINVVRRYTPIMLV